MVKDMSCTICGKVSTYSCAVSKKHKDGKWTSEGTYKVCSKKHATEVAQGTVSVPGYEGQDIKYTLTPLAGKETYHLTKDEM